MFGRTRDREFNYAQCLQPGSEFAACQLANKPVGEIIAREEYAGRMKILKAGR